MLTSYTHTQIHTCTPILYVCVYIYNIYILQGEIQREREIERDIETERERERGERDRGGEGEREREYCH